MEKMDIASKVTMKNESYLCLKYFKTLCISLAFLSLGLCMAMPGPTLPTLAYNLHVNIDSISYVFPARAFGYLLGSILSGFLFGKIDPHLMIAISLGIVSVGNFALPYVYSVIIVAAAFSTTGIAMGFLDTAGNVMCLQTWGDKSGPFMQTLHFSFAIGTTISPLVAKPFIMDVIDTHNNTLINSTESTTPETLNTNDKFTPLQYAFIICGAFSAFVCLSFIYLACCHSNSDVCDQKDTVKQEGWIFRTKMLILLFTFFLIYVGIEVTFGVFVYTFAITCINHYSKDVASMLNTVFWGAFAVGRFIAIPLSKFFKPSRLLQFDLLGTLIAAILLSCFPYYAKTADYLLWIAVALYGVSMASIFPSGFSWAEQYITITGKAAIALVVGAALGEMICPFIVGQLIDVNPMNLMYTCLVCIILSFINYCLLVWLASTKGKRTKSMTREDITDEEEVTTLINVSVKTDEQ